MIDFNLKLTSAFRVWIRNKSVASFILVYCLNMVSINAQVTDNSNTLSIGNTAPPLKISEWIKGNPIYKFDSGRVYVVEFWATWCQPCLKVMPQLYKTSKKYRSDVTFLSVNVYEKRNYPKARAKEIIDSIGKRINYAVGFDDNDIMATSWIDATWDGAIPRVYVINADGKIAWIGHPKDLDNVLKPIVGNKWDITSASKKRNLEYQIYIEDAELREEVMRFFRNGSLSDFYGEPDSALVHIDHLINEKPELKYAYHLTFHKFSALLKTDMQKALVFGREATNKDNPLGPQYTAVIQCIKYHSHYLGITPEIYLLGASLLQEYGHSNPVHLITASEWFWLGGQKKLAMKCAKKARKRMQGAKTNQYGTFF